MAWSTSYVTRLSKVDRKARRFSSVLFLLSIVLKWEEMIVGLVGGPPEFDVRCFVISSKERDIDGDVHHPDIWSPDEDHVQLEVKDRA